MSDMERDIGKLLAQTQLILTQQEELYGQIEELKDQNVDLKVSLVEFSHRQDSLEKKLEEMIPDLTFLNNLKQRGIGIASVFGVIFASLGYFADKIFKH